MEIESQKDTIREMLIIGNGFDLQCNLKTQYKDFFYHRFGIDLLWKIFKNNRQLTNSTSNHILQTAIKYFKNYFYEAMEDFNTRIDGYRDKKSNGWVVNYYTGKFREMFKNISDIDFDYWKEDISKLSESKFTNWDIIFIYCFLIMNANSQHIQWNDVESIIYEVVTTVLTNDNDTFTYENNSNSEIKKLFIRTIKYAFKEQKKDYATAMLDNLQKFEKIFAKYILQNIDNNRDQYYYSAANLIKNIVNSNNYKVVLDVINFNYSLDEKMINDISQLGYLSNIKINSWVNIHGIAASKDRKTRNYLHKIHGGNAKLSMPIFGIDGHDILSSSDDKILDFNDQRIPFTKSFRLIDNQVNVMRDRNHQFQAKVDKIVFYGHSLGHADYSYFETLFDIYKIYSSDVVLDFYYHSSNENLKNRNSEREVLKSIVNLLTSYGQTLSNQHGENIVNRLVLEQRLNLFPSPSK